MCRKRALGWLAWLTLLPETTLNLEQPVIQPFTEISVRQTVSQLFRLDKQNAGGHGSPASHFFLPSFKGLQRKLMV